MTHRLLLPLLCTTLLLACGDKSDDDTGSAAGSGDDGGTDDPLVSGDGFGIVYAAGKNIGIDGRLPVSATFDYAGLFTAYVASENESPDMGDCTSEDTATIGGVAVGRWAGGTLVGEFYGGTFTFPEDDGFHYGVVAKPQDTGVLGLDGAYSLAWATPATISDASLSPGEVTAEAVVTAGEGVMVALQITVDQGGDIMTVSTPGYPDPASATTNTYEGQISGPVEISGGPYCSDGGCSGYLRGLFADDGQLLVMAWQASKEERISGVVLLEAP